MNTPPAPNARLAESLTAGLADDGDPSDAAIEAPAFDLQLVARELELDEEQTATLVVPGGGVTPSQAAALRSAAEFLDANLADSTRANYQADFVRFATWCRRDGHTSLPATPLTVLTYLGHLGALRTDQGKPRYAVPTLERRLAAINWKHEITGYVSPTSHAAIRRLMKGIRRKIGRPARQKPPFSTDQIARMVTTLELDTPAGLRDRALLLFGYAGAFRRSELAGLDKQQITRRADEGLVITLEHTKDDQEGKGRKVGIPAFPGSPLCPVAAYDAWLDAAGNAAAEEGPVFRRIDRWGHIGTQPLSPQSVALIIKRAALSAGIKGASEFAGHSLRAGHATTAADNQAPDRLIMRTTGHSSVETLERYIRDGNILKKNSARYLGLDRQEQDE